MTVSTELHFYKLLDLAEHNLTIALESVQEARRDPGRFTGWLIEAGDRCDLARKRITQAEETGLP